jgi:diamine N-acetyltransferase
MTNNSNTFISVATIADAFELAMFSGESFYNTYAAFNTPENMDMYVSKAFAVGTIENEIADSNNVFLLLRENSYLIGYAKLTNNLPENISIKYTTIELARLYIAENAKGKGFGKMLLTACYTHALQQQCQTIWLGVWQQNRAAIAFYNKMGFTTIGVHQFLLGDDVQDDFVMIRTIGG